MPRPLFLRFDVAFCACKSRSDFIIAQLDEQRASGDDIAIVDVDFLHKAGALGAEDSRVGKLDDAGRDDGFTVGEKEGEPGEPCDNTSSQNQSAGYAVRHARELARKHHERQHDPRDGGDCRKQKTAAF